MISFKIDKKYRILSIKRESNHQQSGTLCFEKISI